MQRPFMDAMLPNVSNSHVGDDVSRLTASASASPASRRKAKEIPTVCLVTPAEDECVTVAAIASAETAVYTRRVPLVRARVVAAALKPRNELEYRWEKSPAADAAVPPSADIAGAAPESQDAQTCDHLESTTMLPASEEGGAAPTTTTAAGDDDEAAVDEMSTSIDKPAASEFDISGGAAAAASVKGDETSGADDVWASSAGDDPASGGVVDVSASSAIRGGGSRSIQKLKKLQRQEQKSQPTGRSQIRIGNASTRAAASSSAAPPPPPLRASQLQWEDQDALIDAAILHGVPEDDLRPCAKPMRSEKATLLLWGYVSEADKAALQRLSPPHHHHGEDKNSSSQLHHRTTSSDSALSMSSSGGEVGGGEEGEEVHVAEDTPTTLDEQQEDDVQRQRQARMKAGLIDPSFLPRSAAQRGAAQVDLDRQQPPHQQPDPFLLAEERLERRRFCGEKWLEKIVFSASLNVLRSILVKRFRERSLQDVVTPWVWLRVRRWRARASRSALLRKREAEENSSSETSSFHLPPALLLKRQCAYMLDWPLAAIEAFLSSGKREAYARGEALFHEGDPTQDVFVLLHGTVEAVVMRGGKFDRATFHEAYLTARNARNQETTTATRTTTTTTTTTVDGGASTPPDSAVLRGDPRDKRRLRPTSCFAPAAAHNDSNDSSSLRVAEQKQKALTKNAPHTVNVFPHASVIGLDSLLTQGEPREYTAWVTSESGAVVLRVPRDDVVASMYSVAHVTRPRIESLAWQERHRIRYRSAFPIPNDALTLASNVFALWHPSAMQDLMAKAHIQVYRKGDTLCKQGNIAGVGCAELLLILRGAVDVGESFATMENAAGGGGERVVGRIPPGGGVALRPFGVLGEEEVVLTAQPSRVTAVVRAPQTVECLVLTQDDVLSVARHHGECGTYARAAVCARIASRCIKPTNCPPALLHDSVMRYLFPVHVLRKLWEHYAKPVYFMQGEGVFRAWEEASYVYLVLSGTLFQQYGEDGPKIPVANLSDLQMGTMKDDDVQLLQVDGLEEDNLYNAMMAPGAYVKSSKRRGTGTSSSAVADGTTGGGGSPNKQHQGGLKQLHVWVPLERNLVVDDERHGGLVVGALEMAMNRPTYLSHLRATSGVVAWRWDRREVETMLQRDHPAIWSAMRHPQSVACVQRHLRDMTLRQLEEEAAPRNEEAFDCFL